MKTAFVFTATVIAAGLIAALIRIDQLQDRVDRLDKVHRIFEDGSVCHLDPDGPTYCAR